MEPQEIAPGPEPPAPVASEPPASIADHAAQFGPTATREPISETPEPVEPVTALPGETPAQTAQRARDEQGRFARERHRARSQKAKPEDVGRIGELTKKYRTAEQERDKWKSRYERESAAWTAQQAPQAASAHAATPTPKAPPPVAKPGDGKPSWRAFEEQIGTTYETWGDAQDAYIDARDSWKDTQARQQLTAEQAQAADRAVVTAYAERLQTFKQQTPDFEEKLQAAMGQDDQLPAPLYHAILRDDNGPALLYHLLTHPDLLDEMRLLGASLPATDASVALLRRRLSQLSRSQAVTTGSAAAIAPHVIAPRPPNPVRTGSMKAGDEPPGAGASIADHAKFYGRKARR